MNLKLFPTIYIVDLFMRKVFDIIIHSKSWYYFLFMYFQMIFLFLQTGQTKDIININ